MTKRVTITAVFDVEDDGFAETFKDGLPVTRVETEGHWIGLPSAFDDGGEADTLVSSDIIVTDPPREWKFGDIVTRDDHPDGDFTVVDKDGDSISGEDAFAVTWSGYAPFRLVAIDGKVLD